MSDHPILAFPRTQPDPAVLEAVLTYALGYGWPILPVHTVDEAGRCSCGNSVCDRAGVHPRIRLRVQGATTDERTIRHWWAMWPEARPAIATGDGSGLVALLVDPARWGEDTLYELKRRHGPLPHTVEAVGRFGKRTVLFRHLGRPVTNAQSRLGPGLVLKGYVELLRSRGSCEFVVTRCGILPVSDVRCGGGRVAPDRPALPGAPARRLPRE